MQAPQLPDWAQAREVPHELGVLLAAARREGATYQGASIDWPVLLAAAQRQGLVAQLCRWAESTRLAPASFLTELQRDRQQITLRNLYMTGELAALLELFAKRGIQAVPFKGPTLAALVNTDLSWRSFADLDLLVDRREVARASDVLRERGYQLRIDWQATQDARFLDVTYDLEFFRPDTGLMVELHWELFPRYMGFGFDFFDMRTRLTPVTVCGKPMVTLGREDLLLYLCAHGAKHLWQALNSVLDVARVIECFPDWDWEMLLASARQRKLERVVLLGLLLARGLLAAPVPEWVEQRALQDSTLKRLGRQTVAAMLASEPEDVTMRRQFRYFSQLQQSWPARLRYWMRVIGAPNVGDWQFCPLERRWSFLYVLLRPFRLLKKYLGGQASVTG